MIRHMISLCIFCNTDESIKDEGMCRLCKWDNWQKKRLIKKLKEENKKKIIIF